MFGKAEGILARGRIYRPKLQAIFNLKINKMYTLTRTSEDRRDNLGRT